MDKGMTKKEMIRKVRDVIVGNTAMQYAVFRKKGRRWYQVDCGLGIPLRENYPPDCLIFRHDRNECTIDEAKYEVEREISERDFRMMPEPEWIIEENEHQQ